MSTSTMRDDRFTVTDAQDGVIVIGTPSGGSIVGPPGAQGPPGPQGPTGEAGSGVTIKGTLSGTSTPLPVSPEDGDMWLLGTPVPTAAPNNPATGTKVAGEGIIWEGAAWVNVGPIRGPEGPAGATGATGATGPAGTPGTPGAPGATGPAGPGVPAGGSATQMLAKIDGTDYNTAWVPAPTGGGGTGVTDGDKGDITVSVSGAVWTVDPSTITNTKLANVPATTLKGNSTVGSATPADLSVATVKSMLAINNVDNTADAAKPVSTAQSVALALKTDKTTAISTTAPLTGGGDLSTTRTLGISDFTVSTNGSVPTPGGTSSGRFLKDDGTWTLPPSGVSGAGNVFPFTYNTSTVESITGNQMRGNNATFTASTKLWISEITVDGLDVTVGLSRIKAGFQVYVQDYTSAARYALFNVTADAIDKGNYWEIAVALASSAGTIPGGKVALQSLSTAQSSTLFSTTTTAPGLTPGSNNAGTSAFLRADRTWAAPSDATKVTNGGGVATIRALNQAAYDAIVTKDPTTLYVIV